MGNSRFISPPATAPSIAIWVIVLVRLLYIAFPLLNTCSLIIVLSFLKNLRIKENSCKKKIPGNIPGEMSTNSGVLLSSRLYCRFWNSGSLCFQLFRSPDQPHYAGRGLYRRYGIPFAVKITVQNHPDSNNFILPGLYYKLLKR